MENTAAKGSAANTRRGPVVFLAALFLVGVGLLVWTAVLSLKPPAANADLAEGAREYLRERQVVPLSGDLEKLLADPKQPLVPSQDYPLLDKPAPPFELPDVEGKPWSLQGAGTARRHHLLLRVRLRSLREPAIRASTRTSATSASLVRRWSP